VTTATPTLPDALRLGPVHLTVPDVARASEWYQRSLGLVASPGADGAVELGDGSEPVLVLHEDSDARPPNRREAGLYHYALLYPSRRELARAALRLGDTQTPIQGASDHRTHEAIYLPDVFGNGIELAADRPREAWPRGLGYDGGPAPLDFADLLGSVERDDVPERVGPGLQVGHLHLHVGDVDEGLAFYRDVIGFEEQANLGSAAFVSAGGYHHHLGFNVWRGDEPVPPGTIGMERWTVVLPSGDDVARVRERVTAAGLDAEDADGGFVTRDPWRNALHVRT
jgi:catechol 2,3-dioxygenase